MESEAPQGCVGQQWKNFWSITKNSCFHTTNSCHQLCDCGKIWQITKGFLKFPLKGPLLQLLNNIWNWHKIIRLAWTFSWSRGLLRCMFINAIGLLVIYKAITVLMTIKNTKMALVNMYLTIGGMKMRVFGYTPEIFSLWPPAALWGLPSHTL